MKYVTIWKGSQEQQLVHVKQLFEKNNIDFIYLDKTPENYAKMQVAENDEDRAKGLLLANGFIIKDKDKVKKNEVWKWLIFALLCLAIAALLMDWLM